MSGVSIMVRERKKIQGHEDFKSNVYDSAVPAVTQHITRFNGSGTHLNASPRDLHTLFNVRESPMASLRVAITMYTR